MPYTFKENELYYICLHSRLSSLSSKSVELRGVKTFLSGLERGIASSIFVVFGLYINEK